MAPPEPTTAFEAEVRRAVSADGPGVAETFWRAREAAVPTMPAVVHSRASVEAFWAASVDSMEVWVACALGGEQVAFLAMTEEWVHSLYVVPEHQRTGLGSMLLDLAKACRPGGFGLWVFESNARARSFYARHGLVERERTDGSQNEERAPVVRMQWVPAGYTVP